MKLENQCVSLELSKKLKKLDVEQDSLFYWEYGTRFIKDKSDVIYPRDISAFTVAELGLMLPWRLDFGDGIPKFWYTTKVEEGFEVGYQSNKDTGYVDGFVRADTEANVRAKMLIYLLENKLITL